MLGVNSQGSSHIYCVFGVFLCFAGIFLYYIFIGLIRFVDNFRFCSSIDCHCVFVCVYNAQPSHTESDSLWSMS